MSYFTEFCTKGKSCRQFLVITNKDGEMGVASLDDDSKPEDWAFGDAADCIENMLNEIAPTAKIIYNDEAKSVGEATKGMCATAEDVCEILNIDDPTRRDAKWHFIHLLYTLDRLDEWVDFRPLEGGNWGYAPETSAC